MEETIVIPSPSWFQVSIMSASQDGWLVYGGPSKSLSILEPVDSIGTIDSKQRFKAHTFHRAHKEKIVSVDISPEWPEKRNIVTGGVDGVVKEWALEPKERSWSINYLHCHEEHSVQNEEVAGVCYATPTFAVSVGNSGQICKWDLNTNVVKEYATHLRSFKPTCISCSPHKQLHVAIGTRQGVIFVIDISGIAGKLIYKVRGQDDEINRVSWCPQYSVNVNKVRGPGKEKRKGKESFSASGRMERIRNDLAPSEALETAIAEKKQTVQKTPNKEDPEEEVIIPEDDMFDVYKDPEASEFGHKKYEPEDILVKVKEEAKDDFLAECEKLKVEILKKKNEPEESIESLVAAMDKAHVEEAPGDTEQKTRITPETQESQSTQENTEYCHLLASIGKYGGVNIWTQTGKLLASCTVLFHLRKDQKDFKNRGPNWPTLHWFKPDSLLMADGKNQLLNTNPLNIDSKHKLEWRVVHSLHRRGLYFISSDAPRVQTPETLADPASDNWVVWTIGQDRNLISYNMKENKKIEVFATCGGYIYEIRPCVYDAGKIAFAAGDGSIRVWETHTTNELEEQLASGVFTSYWQNVQGKIFTLAWHPTKENLLAFGTGESRVGILDACGSEKPAKDFRSFFRQGVYSLTWGEGMNLYVCGNGVLAMFRANKIDEPAKKIAVEVEGQEWEISAVLWTAHGLMVGALNGGVALLDRKDYHVISATFVFLKMIYSIAWHPQQVTSSQEESKYQNYIAVCSIDKVNTIAILEYEDKGDGAIQFKKLKSLPGHKGAVLQIAWNPHRDAQLLSTSADVTVRIWNVIEGECIAIFGGHTLSAQSAMWCAQPRLADKVLSCGGDHCIRLWDIKDYPLDSFTGVRKEAPKKRRLRAKEQKERKKEKKLELKNIPSDDTEITEEPVESTINECEESQSENVATTVELRLKGSKHFLLPTCTRQIGKKNLALIDTILLKYIEENNGIDLLDAVKTCMPEQKGFGFLKMFGTLNELNELLDSEAEYHMEAKDWEAHMMLLFYRGKVDDMIQFASENDLLDPYLLSLSPSVSFKYWKDTVQRYVAQLDRVAAKGNNDNTNAYNLYGGIVLRKATALLSLHDVKGCIQVLIDSDLFKEAYILCRLRHMDSIAEEVLRQWADTSSSCGQLMLASIIHLIRGDVSEASVVLGRSNQLHYLRLAGRMAKLVGLNTYASHIETRVETKESEIVPETKEELKDLPSRVEALLRISDGESKLEELGNAKSVNGNVGANKSSPSEVLNGIAPTTNGNILVVASGNNRDVIESKE